MFTARLFSTQLVSSAQVREDDIIYQLKIKNICSWCFLKRHNRTQQFELLEFGMPFQQTRSIE